MKKHIRSLMQCIFNALAFILAGLSYVSEYLLKRRIFDQSRRLLSRVKVKVRHRDGVPDIFSPLDHCQ